ncbi:MAG TPA: hypothetical protein VFV66_34075, partial [Nonomuraea sp.]|nr:hypothetical protein [Nonomuraea sp.]
MSPSPGTMPMPGPMSMDPVALLPELIILAGAVTGLVIGLFLPRRRQHVVAWICAIALVAAAAATLAALTRPDRVAFESYAIDPATNAARLTVSLATLLAICLAARWARDHPRESEL